MSSEPIPPTVISFGPFEVDLRTQELKKHGVRLRLPGQSFQILARLLRQPGGLVPREELQQALWPADTHVDFERGVNAAVNRLRDVLGDSADNPTFIETLPRRGYRFIAPIEGLAAQEAGVAQATVGEKFNFGCDQLSGISPGKKPYDVQQSTCHWRGTNSDLCCAVAQPAAAADGHQYSTHNQ